jgi:putative SOS response-associated peptidase YedK
MCGRFTLTWEEWRQISGALCIQDERDAAVGYRPRFSSRRLISTSSSLRNSSDEKRNARWGLVNRWARDNSRASQSINAKAETLEQRPTFREAFLHRRCVIPVDGFYEWTGPKSKRLPLWIHPPDRGLMLFAGLYESWYPEKNQPEVIPQVRASNQEEIERAAERCRMHWGLGLDVPIKNVVRVMERAGVAITRCPGIGEKVDAFSRFGIPPC